MFSHTYLCRFSINLIPQKQYKTKECDSYEEVLKAVSNKEAEAGVLPSYVAGSMMIELYYDLELRVPFQLDLKVPVKMLYNPRLFQNNTKYVQCANTYLTVIFEMYIRKYKEFVQVCFPFVHSIIFIFFMFHSLIHSFIHSYSIYINCLDFLP